MEYLEKVVQLTRIAEKAGRRSVQPGPVAPGQSVDVLRTFGVRSVHSDFVGSKREMSPNRARQAY